MAKLTEAAANNNPMVTGESRTYEGTWKDSGARKACTIYRTNRPYVYDLCDAYNASRSDTAKANKLEWFVDKSGGLQLGKPADLIEKEAAERWNARNAR